jgi:Cys-tRNA(Pro)/Cys-tRNA(Cys) deacylase
MKKRFPTYFHSTALEQDVIYVSAGIRGLQIEIAPDVLIEFVQGVVADVASNK